MKDSATFLRDLAASQPAVSRFVTELNANRVYAEMLPHEVRTHVSERHRFADNGDVAACFRIEHKMRTIRFKDAASFPFATVYIDEVYKFNKKAREDALALLAYVIESADHECAAVIYNWTQPQWNIARGRWDPKQDRHCDYYEISKNLVRFCNPADAFGPRIFWSSTETADTHVYTIV